MPVSFRASVQSSIIVLAGAVRAVAKTVLVIVPLGLLTACGGSRAPAAPGPEKPDLVVGAVPAESAVALYIAQERGIFAAHGLRVKVEAIASTSDIIPDMLNGGIDVASGQFPGFIAAQAAGVASFHVLATGLVASPGVNEIVALKSSGIGAPVSLRGKSISVNALAGDGPLLVDALLATYEIKPGQVTLKELPFPAMGAALAARQVDAAYCTEPYCTEMEQQYGARVVADTDQGAAAGLPIAGYTVTTAWLHRYPRTAAAFAASIVAASLVADADVAAVQHALVVSLHLSSQVADVAAPVSFPTSVIPAELQQVANLMFEFGELKSYFSVRALTGTHGAG
jgi:NitT/TauT family transport system substrate-binding protein